MTWRNLIGCYEIHPYLLVVLIISCAIAVSTHHQLTATCMHFFLTTHIYMLPNNGYNPIFDLCFSNTYYFHTIQ
uniref:Uncharacterized protein n=1 Tax=Helianthus annuus TaxID=4232 RepID=A0A251U1F6_HELAN